MTDYSKAVIYKITCKDQTIKDIYVGSTTNLKRRIGEHKSDCNNKKKKNYNYLIYKTIRENGGWDNWKITVNENYQCDSKIELLKREKYWVEELKASLNMLSPIITLERKEYRKASYLRNKEKKIAYQKEYQKINKEKRKEYEKEYRKKNRAIIKEKRKEYQKINKEKRKEYDKEYRKKNRAIIKEKKGEKITCECGSVITKDCLARHKRSKKHQDFIKSN